MTAKGAFKLFVPLIGMVPERICRLRKRFALQGGDEADAHGLWEQRVA
jgi:hypothetical protein